MRIAIIGNLLAHQNPTGIENYLHNLAQSLADLEGLQITLFGDESMPSGLVHDSVPLKKLHVPIGIKKTTIAPIFLDISSLDKYDVLHCPTVMAPLGVMKKGKLKTVMTVHDMVPAQFPKLSNVRKFVYYKYFLKYLF